MSCATPTKENEARELFLSRVERRLREEGRDYLIPLAREMAEGPLVLELMKKREIDCELEDKVYQALQGTPPEGYDFIHPSDKRMLEHCTARAFCHRIKMLQTAIQRLLRDQRIPADPVIASIPCGYIRELLTIDYGAFSPRVIGIDNDHKALDGARQLANELGFSRLDLYLKDALMLGPMETVDVIADNSLALYLDDTKALRLYDQYYGSLTSGGYCITSHMTPPVDWNRDLISAEELELQENFFNKVVQGHWLKYMRSIPRLCEMLERVGFEVVEVHKDPWGINPCFVARRD